MKEYKKIHIWEFPPTLTFIKLNEKFRIKLFKELKFKNKSIADGYNFFIDDIKLK